MAHIGQLGCTITRQFVWGIEVTNTSRTFRGTVTTKKNGIIVRINGDETCWSGTHHRGAVRFLRKHAQRAHLELRLRVANQVARDEAAIERIAERTQKSAAAFVKDAVATIDVT